VGSCEPVLRFWSLRGAVFELFLNLGMARYDFERRIESISGWDEPPLVTVSDRDAERVRDSGEPGKGRGGCMSRSSTGSVCRMNER
jgi:hypothetical protein